MPDLQDISDAISELKPEAITDKSVLASKKEPPADYNVVAQTTDGFDTNLWKDGIFKSKVTRYLCFSRASSTKNKQLCNVAVEMKLIDLKDCFPEGFTPIQDTIDTQEQALRKERLCMKLIPRHSAETAIYDVVLQGKSKQSLANYTFIGLLPGLFGHCGHLVPPRSARWLPGAFPHWIALNPSLGDSDGQSTSKARARWPLQERRGHSPLRRLPFVPEKHTFPGHMALGPYPQTLKPEYGLLHAPMSGRVSTAPQGRGRETRV
ncbi:multivesicular body subunit 12B-like [Myxocyprinus asiaticus]|uniref:multivesicular body subunit 12B-like n=1 Tax=Myxocyprinus asiaticus TaxID=70543 RepID=UPI0022233B57|nr:multivesicular body subunit 12B-like [Myxocyprinus asiaticus]